MRARNPDGATPLHWAVFRNALQCMETLLRAGADRDAADTNGYQACCSTLAIHGSVSGRGSHVLCTSPHPASVGAPGPLDAPYMPVPCSRTLHARICQWPVVGITIKHALRMCSHATSRRNGGTQALSSIWPCDGKLVSTCKTRYAPSPRKHPPRLPQGEAHLAITVHRECSSGNAACHTARLVVSARVPRSLQLCARHRLPAVHSKGLKSFSVHVQDGRTPLHWAAYKGFHDCVRLLLVLGCSPHDADVEGCNVLHWAALRGNSEAATLIVQVCIGLDTQC